MATDQLGSIDMPGFGLGTLRNDDPDECAESVKAAIEMGYRHVDTGEMYGVEEYVGTGLAAASVPLDEVFLATKVLHPRVSEEATPEEVVEHGHKSLDLLDVDSVDLFYLHWPDDYDLEAAFEGYDRLSDEGAFDHFGVCNFTPELLDEALDLDGPPIEVHQVELHPLLQQEELREHAAENDMALVAYCPVLRGGADEVPELVEIAEKHDATAAQVSLAWIRSKGVIPIPKARGAHIRENWESLELELDEEDVAKIDGIDREERIVDPPFAVW